MKKTLLIAVAALAAGIISTQAQAVYSQNIVGYYNVTIPAGKFALVGAQLNLDNTNNAANLFTGLVSDANGTTNTQIWYWTGGGYQNLQYFSGADADNYFILSGSANGFYDTGGTAYNINLPVGHGTFLQNLFSQPITITVTGGVALGTNVVTLSQGFNMVSAAIPVSTNLCGSLLNFNGVSDYNGSSNDQIWYWTGSGYQNLQYFTGADADSYFIQSGSVNGFYDTGGTVYNITPPVGNGFFIQRLLPGSATWTNVLNVP